jgi:hypothetical protein
MTNDTTGGRVSHDIVPLMRHRNQGSKKPTIIAWAQLPRRHAVRKKIYYQTVTLNEVLIS